MLSYRGDTALKFSAVPQEARHRKEEMKRSTRLLAGAIAAGSIAAADQLAKWSVRKHVPEGKRLLLSPLTGSTVEVNHCRNYGMAHNVGENAPKKVRYITTAATVGTAVLYAVHPGVSEGLILGGGISNLVDRWKDGYVTDYVSFDIGIPALKNLSFNLADLGVFAGTAGMVAEVACRNFAKQAVKEYGTDPDGSPRSTGRAVAHAAAAGIWSAMTAGTKAKSGQHRKGFQK